MGGTLTDDATITARGALHKRRGEGLVAAVGTEGTIGGYIRPAVRQQDCPGMAPGSNRLPWYAWPLIPLVLPAVLLIMIPLAFLAAIMIPYFVVFPDRHAAHI